MNPMPSIPLWHGLVCWHPRRTFSRDVVYGAWTMVSCPDCGAEVKAAYGCTLVDLLPMPVDADGKALTAVPARSP